MKTHDLTQKRLMEVLKYDPASGQFERISRRNPKVGRLDKDGYLQISVDGVKHQAHRLAWLYMTGEHPPPEKHVDHKNRIRNDNRWTNLRTATPTENEQNKDFSERGPEGSGASGVRGVYWDGRKQRWHVQVRRKKKMHYGGYHKDIQAAAADAKALREQLVNDAA